MMVSFLGFLFASYSPDLELKKLEMPAGNANNGCRLKKPSETCPLQSQNQEIGSIPIRLLDNKYSATTKHYRKNYGRSPTCARKG